ncbi:MAG: energy transducer TonB [Sphingobacteriaceae bacterium]|nr:energy transducer TonB [Sphingobacteriaceae bacterium]
MSYLLNNQQKMNEIIFMNKNRSYGAYILRSQYGNTVVKALSWMILGMGLILSMAYYSVHRGDSFSNEQIIPTDIPNFKEVIFNLEKPQPKAAPDPAPKPKSASAVSSAISTNISDTAVVNTNTVTNENMNLGSSNTSSSTNVSTTNTNSGTGSETGTLTTGGNNEVHMIADSSPEFEGGLKALYAHLSSHLKFPEQARDAGKDGTVHVRFVVDENGKVSKAEALNKVGFGMEVEAIRVVSSIPAFKKPGMMNGKPVKVYYTLPISFKYR